MADADHLQNFVYDQFKGIDDARLAADLRKAPKYLPIPDSAYDCQTHSPTPVRVLAVHGAAGAKANSLQEQPCLTGLLS